MAEPILESSPIGNPNHSWKFIALLRGLAALAQRITGISTPFFGVQLAPTPSVSTSDTSFRRVQDERALMDEIWLVAVTEAYCAKDASRRLQEYAVSREEVIDKYLVEQRELKRWVDRNIEAGTCAAAVLELRKRREEMKHERAEQRIKLANRQILHG